MEAFQRLLTENEHHFEDESFFNVYRLRLGQLFDALNSRNLNYSKSRKSCSNLTFVCIESCIEYLNWSLIPVLKLTLNTCCVQHRIVLLTDSPLFTILGYS